MTASDFVGYNNNMMIKSGDKRQRDEISCWLLAQHHEAATTKIRRGPCGAGSPLVQVAAAAASTPRLSSPTDIKPGSKQTSAIDMGSPISDSGEQLNGTIVNPAAWRGRGGALSLVTAVEGQAGSLRKKTQRQAQLLCEPTAKAVAGKNGNCFRCSGQHWSTDTECPARSGSAAVQKLASNRSIWRRASCESKCTGCGGRIKLDHEIKPMDGVGLNGNTNWWHRSCQQGQLAKVQSSEENTAEHHDTPAHKAILDWVRDSEPQCSIVKAGPGAGKTALVVRVCKEISAQSSKTPGPSSDPVVMAYNKDAARELMGRGVLGAKTFHSYGYGLLRQSTLYKGAKLTPAKTRTLLKEMYPPVPTQLKAKRYREDVRKLVKHVVKLVALAKAYALDPNSDLGEFEQGLQEIIQHHKIVDKLSWELKGAPVAAPLLRIREMAKEVLHLSIERAQDTIDYDDMIYMPVLMDLVKPHCSGWVIVDECQDMDQARSLMAQKLAGRTGRLLAVGDDDQSLYDYTGAGGAVLSKLRAAMPGSKIFPLSCTWRLPRLHVCLVTKFMHDHGRFDFTLEPKPDANEGMIAQQATFASHPPDAKGDHAIICRTNAPLMRLRLELMRRNIPCHMSGRAELAKQMTKLLISSKASTLSELRRFLDRIVSGEESESTTGETAESDNDGDTDSDDDDSDGSEGVAAVKQARINFAEAMRDMIGNAGVVNLSGLKEQVQQFHDGDGNDELATPGAQVVRLMTIHKAKGQEFHRVYLFQPMDMLLPMVMQYGEGWEKDMEINAAFVARTRSLADLIFLRHLPFARGAPLDFELLWPPAVSQEVGETNDEDEDTGTESDGNRLEEAVIGADVFDAFAVLGMECPSASLEQALHSSAESRDVFCKALRRAYRSKAKEMHPDKNEAATATADFQKLKPAHDTLKKWLRDHAAW